jgi:hypothetical protein
MAMMEAFPETVTLCSRVDRTFCFRPGMLRRGGQSSGESQDQRSDSLELIAF